MDNLFDLPPLPAPFGEFNVDGKTGKWVETARSGERLFDADQMRAYARAAVEAEQEACARLCDEMAYALDNGGNPYVYDRNAKQLSAKIRARGKS